MNVTEQGARRDRHHVIPRTLIFVTSADPQSAEQKVLLLKGAATKRLWANKYNGLGGHVEAGEDVRAAAKRELLEETGLQVQLTLAGVIHIDTGHAQEQAPPGIMIFVFRGQSVERAVHTTAEGAPEWIPVARLADLPLVDDLPHLLPLVLAGGPIFFGHYQPDERGEMCYTFRTNE
jgi:8-oxo-dGTP diphosphatase